LLHGLGYSLQGNAKTREGRQHVDRDAQFRYIARRVRAAQRQQQPTISVDTKKKELIGDFKNAGRTWRPAKSPQRVRVHDFVIPATPTTGGKAIPYGVYDLHRNEGWVSVGIDHDTATFAVQSIRRWWQQMGRPAYRHAQSLLITADAGGSNGVWSVNGPFDLRDDPPDALKYGRGCPSDLWRIVERRWRPQFIRNLRSNHGYRSPDEEPSSRRSSTLLRHFQRLLAVLAPNREGQRTQAPLRNLLAALETISVGALIR